MCSRRTGHTAQAGDRRHATCHTLRDPNGGATSEWSVGGSELVAVQFVALCAAAPSSPTPPLVTVGTDKVTKTLNSVAVFRR